MAKSFPRSDAPPSSIRAWRVHKFGPSEAMSLESIPRPEPGPGQVLVEVHAAGVGPWDAWIRAGKSVLPQPLPLTPGADIAGRVVAIGAGVSDLYVGQEVFGVTNKQFVGGYAEYALASAEMLAEKPSALSYIIAASVPVVAVTAWQALFDYARLQAGDKVLIHGAAGNVGGYAVQFARRARLHCIATAAYDDKDYLRDLGATEVLDYRNQHFESELNGIDAVIDLIGGETQRRSFQILRRGGRLVSTVSQPDQKLAKQFDVEARFFLVEVRARMLREIAQLLCGGELKVRVGEIIPFSGARQAHLMLEGRVPAAKGKIVLRIEEGEER